MAQKITPHLWYDKEAGEAARLYTSIFSNSKINSETELNNTPSGTVETVEIEISGFEFVLLSAGPEFKFSPAISFLVNCSSKEEVDEVWERLSKNGNVLMELGSYPFSGRYGWLEDKYGLSWQIMLASGEYRQKIVPTMMFTGQVVGEAEAAVKFYTSMFKNTKIGSILRYGQGEEPDAEGTIKHVDFTLEGQEFVAMDSARMHNFTFNETISFIVNCRTQEEIDYYWDKLSADPVAEQCGWLKDKFGVSWQVTPIILSEMLADKDEQRVAQVTQAFLKMKKIDIESLRRAYEGI